MAMCAGADVSSGARYCDRGPCLGAERRAPRGHLAVGDPPAGSFSLDDVVLDDAAAGSVRLNPDASGTHAYHVAVDLGEDDIRDVKANWAAITPGERSIADGAASLPSPEPEVHHLDVLHVSGALIDSAWS